MPEEKYAFISYSHKDNKIILPIIKELSLVVNVWYDDGIHAGSEWEEIIASRIINCTCFLYFVSKNSIESVNCKNEIHLANKKNKKFIACSGYPECDYIKKEEMAVEVVKKCPVCGGDLVVRGHGKKKFLGCTNYPKCRHIEKINN